MNFPIYRNAERVVGVDPSIELLDRAKDRLSSAQGLALLVASVGEMLPFHDEIFETVVVTWALCTIPKPIDALQEIRRLLRPDGRLLFVEHGLSPEPDVARWQRRLTPCWSRIGGGCHLDRKTDDLIEQAGFHIAEMRMGYMQGPKPMTFMYQDQAVPRP